MQNMLPSFPSIGKRTYIHYHLSKGTSMRLKQFSKTGCTRLGLKVDNIHRKTSSIFCSRKCGFYIRGIPKYAHKRSRLKPI